MTSGTMKFITTNSQILVTKYHPPPKEQGLFREMADFRARAGKIQDEHETSCCSRKLESVQRKKVNSLKELPLTKCGVI